MVTECAIILFVRPQGKVGASIHNHTDKRPKHTSSHIRHCESHSQTVEISVEWNDHRQLRDTHSDPSKAEREGRKARCDLNDMHVLFQNIFALYFTKHTAGCDWKNA